MLLNLEQIQQDAAGRLELVKKTKELQAFASEIYPGCRIMIVLPDADENDAPKSGRQVFANLSGIEQIVTVFMMCGPQMELQQVFAEITRRGGQMSMETLMTHLSRNKEFFTNVARGIWELSNRVSSDRVSRMRQIPNLQPPVIRPSP
jgi:hypothetical protein